MPLDNLAQLEKGIRTAFLDRHFKSDEDFRPQFVYNNQQAKQKVLNSLEKELSRCDEFMVSVAFITMSGITPLLQTFKSLQDKGIHGRILTTNYLNFSEPKALTKLLEFPNIELKMYWSQADVGFHTKGYIFRRGDVYRMIVGSSNLTMNALTKNEEWNTRIISTENGEYANNILSQFETLWKDNRSLKYDDFIEKYSLTYELTRQQRKNVIQDKIVELSAIKFQPNSMQQAFIANLGRIMAAGEERALLISATGTGKTYASAFAAQSKQYKRVLFLVHREQIAKQAIKSYRKIFGATRTYGLLSGTSKETGRDFVFSTMQTMRKPEIMEQFAPDEFELIIIDEAHRIGNNSYQSIIDYFKPSFLLGMTASPDRTDGYDVYSLFNHNIAYEIRLEKALEEDLLCPFHYFGITDLEIDGEVYTDYKLRKFDNLIADVRVDYVIEKINYYGYSGDRVKGLIFCSDTKEAAQLSKMFNSRGFNTLALSGNNTQAEREEAIERLTEDVKNKLDYIFTVDIFNEGVDIPEINQVVMLRPTQSAIIFIQQLGRGLRKFPDKEYVVIIDFIGNYQENNFHIPMALSGDRSYNKDNIRRTLAEGNKIIPGSSTIHFDEISKKRIYSSIDTVKFNVVKLIKENYFKLKFKLGRIPNLMDFEEYGEMDVMCIVHNKSLGSYYKFLTKYEKEEYSIRLSELEDKFLEFISIKFMEGKRIHELEMLDILMEHDNNILSRTEVNLKKYYGIEFKQNTRKHLVNVMTNVWFQIGAARGSYDDCVFIEKDESQNDYRISKTFKKLLQNEDFKYWLKETIAFGKYRYSKLYSNIYANSGFSLYQKYEYEDVCRILEWTLNEVSLNIGGYKYNADTNTYPVFINYEKADNITDTINYDDKFLNSSQFISFSKNKRSLSSDDVKHFINAVDEQTPIELFVRKNKDDKGAKSFYYLGRMQVTDAEEKLMKKTNNQVVEFLWTLDVPVREDIYDYITDND